MKLLNSELSLLAADHDSHSSVGASAKKGSLFTSRASGKFCKLAARTLIAIFGCAAVGWGVYDLPTFARQTPIEHVATHVLDGDLFKPGVLATLMPQVEAAAQTEPCSPAVVRSAAIIRTRLAEQAMVDGNDIDMQLNALRSSIRRSLACTPADPFLWVVLYWVEINRNSFQSDYLDYLRLSYQLGPNEGWIALRRNRLALAVFQRLPSGVATSALDEFTSMLNSGFYKPLVEIFVGPGWQIRDLILPRLSGVAERYRQAFAAALYKQGYDVTVPGIDRRDPRPWD